MNLTPEMLARIKETALSSLSTQAPSSVDESEESSRSDISQNLKAKEKESLFQSVISGLLKKGLICPETFQPLVSMERTQVENATGSWYRTRIGKCIFDMPSTITNPHFLAHGGYGTVAKARYRGQNVAIKKIPMPARADEDEAVRLLREVIIMLKAREQNANTVCEILDVYTNANAMKANQMKHYYLVMPCYSPGSLEELEFKDVTAELFGIVSRDTLLALKWLHVQGILHRDIKRENIFFDKATNRAILGDLGSARELGSKMTGKRFVGTKCYLAPEFIESEPYSFPSDIWSLAISWAEFMYIEGDDTIFPNTGGKDQLLKQKALCAFFERNEESDNEYGRWARKISNILLSKSLEWGSKSYYEIIKSMLRWNPTKRPTCEDLFKNPYFAPYDKTYKKVFIPGVNLNDYEDVRNLLWNTVTIQGRVISEKFEEKFKKDTASKAKKEAKKKPASKPSPKKSVKKKGKETKVTPTPKLNRKKSKQSLGTILEKRSNYSHTTAPTRASSGLSNFSGFSSSIEEDTVSIKTLRTQKSQSNSSSKSSSSSMDELTSQMVKRERNEKVGSAPSKKVKIVCEKKSAVASGTLKVRRRDSKLTTSPGISRRNSLESGTKDVAILN